MAYDPILRWKKSPSADVAKYAVTWALNGAPAGTGSVPRSGTSDAIGYSARFSAHNPTVTLVDGDSVSASLSAVDGGGLDSVVVSVGPVVVPSEPPEAPANVTLSLV